MDSILFSLSPDKTQAPNNTPIDRDLALIRSMLIITKINQDNIIVLGSENSHLPRIILEDTKANDFIK